MARPIRPPATTSAKSGASRKTVRASEIRLSGRPVSRQISIPKASARSRTALITACDVTGTGAGMLAQ